MWVVAGGLLALTTLYLTVHAPTPLDFNLLGQFFSGYQVSVPGVLIGLLWGFVAGFVLGYGFALVRNFTMWSWLVIVMSRAEMDQYSDFLDHI